jgi:hypothetical protein
MKKVKNPVQADDKLQRDIAEQNQLDASGEWTAKAEKPNVVATCGLLCYINSYMPSIQNKKEAALMSMNQMAAHQALYDYMMYLVSKGRVFASGMHQAIRLGDFIVVFLYHIGGSDEDAGKIAHNLQVLEVAHFNPTKISIIEKAA